MDMDPNALLVVLTAVLGLVATYLRFYTGAQIESLKRELGQQIARVMRDVRDDLHRVELKMERLHARMRADDPGDDGQDS